MHVSPAPDGRLLVDHPEPDLRFDIGNPRLYAALHGNGHISDFLLPEGIPVLRTWAVHARLDGVPVAWAEAEAIGRSWTLRGTALDGAVRCRTVCDSERPALFQVWRIENPGTSERVFTLDLDVTFDLRYPAIRVGAASTTARLFHLVRDHPIARRTLGRRRWAILDTIGNAQKRAAGTGRHWRRPVGRGHACRRDATPQRSHPAIPRRVAARGQAHPAPRRWRG